MARKKVISTALAAMLAVSSVWDGSPALYQSMVAKAQTTAQTEETEVIAESGEVDANDYGLCDNIQDGSILHCFDWKYSQIKEELPNIAEAGFTTVQTSPAQKGDGDTWYWLYQPQTFSVQENALGTKAELQALCDEAEKYGIKVMVDVVANHTRSIGDDGLGGDCYHYDEGSIDYGPGSKRYDYTHKRIGMPDLNSESTTVQNKVKGYVQELKGLGVDGIRWDAAKHIGLPSEQCNFWPAVTGEGLYNYGEILNGPLNGYGNNDALMAEYTKYISVTDDEYGEGILNTIIGGGVPGAIGRYSERGVSKDRLVYWAESHDTYANDGEYGKQTAYTDQNLIDRAYALVASQGKAASLYFSRPAEKRKQSIKAGVKGSTHFTAKEVAAVNHLKNNCVGEKEYFAKGNDAAAICRESGATIVKSRGSGQVSIKNGGGLTKPGTYTDEVSGSTWTVTADTISGNVGESGIAVIYNSKGSNGGGGGGDVVTKTTAPGKTNPPSKTTAPGGSTSVSENTIVATMPSGWSDLYIYAYEPGATPKKLTGEWPGTKMSAGSDGKYTYKMDSSVTSAKIIFASGPSGSQDPTDVVGQACGYDYTGGKAFSYDGGKWSELSISKATEKPKATKEPTDAPKKTATPKPEVTKTPADKATEKPKETEEPKKTKAPTSTPTSAPANGNITVSKKNGSSFTDETLDVKITLKGTTKGTYSVDDGPEKTLKSGDTVTLGQGKIADSDVTLKVKAGKDEETFTYHKVFDANNTLVKTSALARIENIFEVVAEAAETNAGLSGAPGSSHYATNPNGQTGSKKTITGASDFTEDMIIAQGAANDNISIFRGSHEGPVYDTYALFGAYDDTNVYLGVQYTNVIDVTDPAQNYPQSDNGKPGNGDIPQMFVFDTNTGDYTDGSTNSSEQTTVWCSNVTFSGDAKVDKVFMYSAKPEVNNTAWFPVSGGKIDYDKCISSKIPASGDAGITYKYEDGFFCSTMNGVNGNGYSGYTPADLNSDSSNWVDFLTTGHSKTQDTFMTMTIPLSTLGVSADEVASNGIGVMSISTFGASGIGSLPMDMSMVDIANEPYSQDDSTSAEKEDNDEVTVALARLGGTGGGGGGSTKPAKTKVPAKTEEPKVTEEPKKTEAPKDEEKVTATPKATATAKPTKEPADDNGDVTETPEPTKVPVADTDVYTVNFGADRSSPQLNTTYLTLKAIGYGSSGYKYEFAVDGKVVQISSTKNTYKWKGKAGEHKIKVTVKDAAGKKITCEKAYVIEQEGGKEDNNSNTDTDNENNNNNTNNNKPAPTPTKKPNKTPTPTLPTKTDVPKVTEEPDGPVIEDTKLSVSMSAGCRSPRKAGTAIPLTVFATGGSAPYIYKIQVQNGNGKKITILSSQSKNKVKWKPVKAGTYKIFGTVTDSEGNHDSFTGRYTITSPISLKTFKLSSSSIKKGKNLKITVKGSSIASVQYQIKVQKIGKKNITTIRKYSKKTTTTWKAKSKGKYYIILYVKDTEGNVKTTKKKVTVK